MTRPRTPLSGRPPGGLDDLARTERVVVYLSPGELAAVQALAELAGKPPAVLARDAILELAWAWRRVRQPSTQPSPEQGC
jgi:hypothetical protein